MSCSDPHPGDPVVITPANSRRARHDIDRAIEQLRALVVELRRATGIEMVRRRDAANRPATRN